MRILCVEDSAVDRAWLRAALTGHDVSIAATGAEAIRIAREQGPFDLAVVDYFLPDAEGEVCDYLAVLHGLPAVVFTSSPDDAREHYRATKCAVVVVGKHDWKALLAAIQDAAPVR